MPRAKPDTTAKARLAELARYSLREFQPGAGRVSRTDDRHHRHGKRRDIAADRHQWRRVVDHLQPRRIIGLA
jgi:hypothetical protein